MKIEGMLDFSRAIGVIPESVAVDVQGRILDYVLSGGSVEDPYVRQQFKYVEKVIRKVKKKEFTQKTLNMILEEIVKKYFAADTIANGYGLKDVIEVVEAKYADEIATLPK